MVRIPSEYQEVEYIESTGTQYIDLNFGFDPTDEIETEFSITIGQLSDKYIVSPNHWNNNANRFAMGVHHGGLYAAAYGNTTTSTTILSPETSNDGKIHKWIYNNYMFSISDVLANKDVSDITFKATTTNLRLFYGYNSNTKGKIASYHHKKQDGTEVNLIPCYHKTSGEIGMYDTVTETFYTNQGTGTFLKGNDVTYDPISLLETRRRILLNTPHIESASGSIVTFNTDLSTNLTDMKIHFHPVQEGTGDPSPDNVRPITGWDGLTVTRCGKNLCPEYGDTNYWSQNAWFDNNGTVFSNNAYKMCDYRAVLPDRKYVLSTTTNSWKGIGFYDEHYAPLAFNQRQSPAIWLTCPSNAKYYRVYSSASAENHQFEEGDEPTSYELYEATSITIPFQKTIYGGYVDLVQGEIVEEWTLADMGSTSWDRAWGTFRTTPTGINIHSVIGTKVNVISEIYPTGTVDSATRVATIDKMIRGRNNYRHTLIRDTDYSEASEFKEAITGYKWAYKLEAPNTYPLTPQTIKALKGINNIWSSANGDVEVKFWKH